MFPNKVNLIVTYVDRGLTSNTIVDHLLAASSNSTTQPSSTSAFAQELRDHAAIFFDNDRQHYISTTRSYIFNSCQNYYKKAKTQSSLLHDNLKIDFGGEEGVDGGALRKEFFLHFLRCADERYLLKYP